MCIGYLSCEYGNEISSVINDGEFLDYLSSCQLLKGNRFVELREDSEVYLLDYCSLTFNIQIAVGRKQKQKTKFIVYIFHVTLLSWIR